MAAAIVVLICLEVTLRYVFDSPTKWGYETQLMVGASLYALSWTYAHRHHAQIRIDVIYTRLSPRFRAGIDTFGALFAFLPILVLLTYRGIDAAVISWVAGEIGCESTWYPPLGPFKTVLAIGIFLFAVQGLVHFIRDSYFLVRNKNYD